MGMGSAPGHGWIISNDDLRKIIPHQLAHFEGVLEENELDLSSLAQELAMGQDAAESVGIALDLLYEAFLEATKIPPEQNERGVKTSALELELLYYSSDDGDRYDELEDGANWSVYGMMELSPAGKKYSDVVALKQWTQFG